MRRLLTLAALVVFAYYGYTVGLPWARERLGSTSRPGSAADEAAAGCVELAVAASDTTVDLLVQSARPPLNPGDWSTVLIEVAGRIGEAESACACPSAACYKATQALGEMRAMVDDFDSMMRHGDRGMGNPATRQERINRLLDEARALAG